MNRRIIEVFLLFVLISLYCLACANKKKENAEQTEPTHQELFHAEIDIKVNEGKNLIMTFDEMERQEKYSIIKLKLISGASVPSSMFILKGIYKIAKMRKALYFLNLKEWEEKDGSYFHKIGFSNDNTINAKDYFGEDIDMNKGVEFTAVKDFDILWGNEK